MSVPMVNAVAQRSKVRSVIFANTPTVHIRRWDDIIAAVFSLIAATIVWVLTVFLSSGSPGEAPDSPHVSSVMQSLVLLPVAAVEGLIVLLVPILVLGALIVRRDFASLVYAVLSGACSVLVAVAVNSLFAFFPQAWSMALAVRDHNGVTFDPGNTYVVHGALVSLAALLTVAGAATVKRSIRWSWVLLAVLALSWVLRSYISLPAALVSLFLGRSVGMVTRWLVGVAQRRVDAPAVFEAAEQVGLSVEVAFRVGVTEESLQWSSWDGQEIRPYEADLPPHVTRAFHAARPAIETPLVSLISPQVFILSGENSLHAMYVFDPSQRLFGTLREIWQAIRLRGLSRWIAPSTKASVERAILATLTAEQVGAIADASVGIVELGEQYALVTEVSSSRCSSLDEADAEVVKKAWETLGCLHARGIAHRNISAHSTRWVSREQVHFIHWEFAEVGSSALSRHIDQVQLLAALATGPLGVRGAVASAREALGDAGLAILAPLVQRAVVPSQTLARLPRPSFLRELRDEVARVAEYDEQEESFNGSVNLQRFSAKSVATWALMFAAVLMVTGMLNVRELIISMSQAHGLWLLGAFVLSTLTWVGGGITLVAFAPEKVGLAGAIGAQVAASLVTVVAPAGTGPASVNLRYLTRSQVSSGAAVVIVAVQQLVQLTFMLVILALMVAVTGVSVAVELPRALVHVLMVGGIGLLLSAVVVVAVPRLRVWATRRVSSLWNRLIPRVRWVMVQPVRVFSVFAGNALMNIGFIGAFWACTHAMGVELALSALVVVYLTANSVGSVVPAPGGIGAVEAALTAGLQVAGVPLAAALPVALAYRLVTFYGRVPFGWIALRLLQARGAL